MNASAYRWVAATFGSQSAATLELATGGDPVMAIGGFNGEGGNITLAQFEALVNKGDIHYFIASGGSGGAGGPGRDDELRLRHHELGRSALHRQDCRRADDLRPHEQKVRAETERQREGKRE